MEYTSTKSTQVKLLVVLVGLKSLMVVLVNDSILYSVQDGD